MLAAIAALLDTVQDDNDDFTADDVELEEASGIFTSSQLLSNIKAPRSNSSHSSDDNNNVADNSNNNAQQQQQQQQSARRSDRQQQQQRNVWGSSNDDTNNSSDHSVTLSEALDVQDTSSDESAAYKARRK
jgi:hypothetical protein